MNAVLRLGNPNALRFDLWGFRGGLSRLEYVALKSRQAASALYWQLMPLAADRFCRVDPGFDLPR